MTQHRPELENQVTRLALSATEPSAELTGQAPRLLIVSGAKLGELIEISAERPVVIGRASDCTLSLPYPNVSRNHCRLLREGEQVFIEDLGSTNRTYVNGREISGRLRLNDGDQLSVGNSAMKFFLGSSTEARYHQELVNLAAFDGLTGLYNRRQFMLLLDDDCARVARDGGPLAVVMLDIDHFKRVNDELGHAAGDQALILIAQILREQAAVSMTTGRLGGEEFAVLCRQGGVEAATAHAEHLRTSIQARTFVYANQTRQLSASFGIAGWQSGNSTSDLLKAADAALYHAKEGGRNRVCVAGASY